VPSPEMASLIEPDQLPAGDTGDDVGGVGEAGVSLPPQPATHNITETTRASRRIIHPLVRDPSLGSVQRWCSTPSQRPRRPAFETSCVAIR